MVFHFRKAALTTFGAVSLELWSALPSVLSFITEHESPPIECPAPSPPSIPKGGVDQPPSQTLTFEEIKGVPNVSLEEVRQLFASMYRASYSNALVSDCLNAAQKVKGFPSHESSVPYELFHSLLELYLLTDIWVDKRCLSNLNEAPQKSYHSSVIRIRTQISGGTAHVSVSSVVENYLCEFVECVVDDDKIPRGGLRELEKVWVRKYFPRVIEKPILEFAKIKEYREYERIYYIIWDAVAAIGGLESSSVDNKECMTKEGFTKFFTLIVTYLFQNSTPERAQVGATHIWYECVAATGIMLMEDFVKACAMTVRMYTKVKSKDISAFLERLVNTARRSLPGIPLGTLEFNEISFSQHDWLKVDVSHWHETASSVMKDPLSFYLHDELNSDVYEQNYYTTPTQNRILITGTADVDKTSLARQLAEHCNAVFLDAETLAIKAAEDSTDEFHGILLSCVNENKLISKEVKLALLRRELANPATEHRGYVCGDFLSLNPDEFFRTVGIDCYIPQAFVRVECATALLPLLQQLPPDMVDITHAETLPIIPEEEEEVDSKVVAMRELEARKRRIIELCRKKDTTEDNQSNGSKHGTDMAAADALQASSLLLAVEICAARHRIVDVSMIGNLKDTVDYLCERLKLTPSSITARPELSEEAMENLPQNVNFEFPAPDHEAILVNAWQSVIDEDKGKFQPSCWGKHCPVTFYEDHVLVEGAPIYITCYRGKVYYLASQRKFKAFMASPHRYLAHELISTVGPMLLLQTKHDVFSLTSELSPHEAPLFIQLEEKIAVRLKLTPVSLKEYIEQWAQQQKEVEIRVQEVEKRTAHDNTARKSAQDRAIKRQEAEAKRKKKAKVIKKKTKGKETKKTVVQDEKNVEVEPEEEIVDDDIINQIPAIDATIQASIDALKNAKRYMLPSQLVSVIARTFDVRDLETLLEWKVLPQNVVVFENHIPKQPISLIEAPDEEDEEEGINEEGEIQDENASAVQEKQLDENGNEIPPSTKPFNIANAKTYRTWMEDFLSKLKSNASGGVEGELGREVPQPVTEPSGKVFLPPLVVKMKNVNIYSTSSQQLAERVAHDFSRVSFHVEALDDTDELVMEDPSPDELEQADDFDPDDPETYKNILLKPGKRMANQFGVTSRYCPVTLYDRGVIAPGNPEFCVVYRQKKYLFLNENNMNAFSAFPERYVAHVESMLDSSLPPPRLWILGVKNSGKKTIANSLIAQYDVPLFVSFSYEYFIELITAATCESGGDVRGLFIPSQNNEYLRRAMLIRKQLDTFEENQRMQIELKDKVVEGKEARERALEEGQEVDELDEEEEEIEERALSFEPEEEESKTERLARALRRMGAALTKIEPFASKGYILWDHPDTDQELQMFISEGAYSDCIVRVKVSSMQFLARCAEMEVEKKTTERQEIIKKLTARHAAKQRKMRGIELLKWRRRHIVEDDDGVEEHAPNGGNEDDAENDDEEELPEEEPEPVDRRAILEELERDYEAQNETITSVIDAAKESRIPIIEVNADLGFDGMKWDAVNALETFLGARASLLQASMVLKYTDAIDAIKKGRIIYSSFRLKDPVSLYNSRYKSDHIEQFKIAPRDAKEDEEVEEVTADEDKEEGIDEVEKGRKVKGIEEEDSGVSREEEVEEESPMEEEILIDEEQENVEFLEGDEAEDVDEEELETMKTKHMDALKKIGEMKALRVSCLGNRVYFFKNNSTLLRFMKNPMRYWDQPPPLPMHRAMIVNVAEPTVEVEDNIMRGAPGKQHHSELLQRIIKERILPMAVDIATSKGAVLITVPKLLKWALIHFDFFPNSGKNELIGNVIERRPVRPEFVTMLLITRLRAGDVLKRGAVISNIIRTTADYERLIKEPRLDITVAFSFFKQQQEQLDEVTSAIAERSHITYHVTSERWTNAALFQSVTCINDARNAEGRRILSAMLGFPASIRYTPVTEEWIRGHVTKTFKNYCPYMWARKGELVDMSKDRRFSVEFLGSCYSFSQAEYMKEFLLHPELFVGSKAIVKRDDEEGNKDEKIKELEIPKELPHVIKEADIPQGTTIELCRCCPVTLYNTGSHIGLCGIIEPTAVEGNLFVKYDNKYYAIYDEENLQRFLRKPWVFAKNAALPPPHKLPRYCDNVHKVPSHEFYINNTIYESLARAMVAAAETRPKYPGLSLEESALKFIALYLKAHNDIKSEVETKQYMENFQNFVEQSTLYKHLTNTPPEDPELREKYKAQCRSWDSAVGVEMKPGETADSSCEAFKKLRITMGEYVSTIGEKLSGEKTAPEGTAAVTGYGHF